MHYMYTHVLKNTSTDFWGKLQKLTFMRMSEATNIHLNVDNINRGTARGTLAKSDAIQVG